MALTAIQTKLGNITVPPTPKVGSSLTEVQQNTFTWTKQAQQTLVKISKILGGLDTSQIPQGGTTVIGNTPTPPGVYFTPALARAALSVNAPLLYDNTTGVFSIPGAGTANDGYLTFTDWNTFNGKLSPSRLINTTAPLAGGGALTADLTLTISLANTSTNGYLSSTDWNTFNGKLSTARLLNTTAPLTGGGDLTADRTFAITLATTSTDGYLSSTDWNTFNTKVPASRLLNTTAPLTGGGDLSADRTFAMPKADGTHDGYLSSADWTTFSAGGGGGCSCGNAKADGTTLGLATFLAADFNDNGSGLISLDYSNGQKATGSQPGFLTSTDWTTFNSKVGTARQILTTSPLSGGGDLSADRTIVIADAAADGTTKGAATFTATDFNSSAGLISLDYANAQKATSGQPGFLTSTDWTTFNSKVGTARQILTTAPLSGGGDLTADRTIVIADAAADGTTKGAATFTSSDFNSTAGLISLDYSNGQKATSGQPGFLTSTDWSTFNNKVGTARLINTTAPITGGGDLSADRTLAMAKSTASVDGYLAATDFTIFNAKVATSRQILTTTPLTGGGDLSADRTIVIPKATASVDGYLSAADFTTFSAAGASNVISSNRTYFVDVTNGADTNNGLASGSGHAFKTIQKAVNTVEGFFINGGVVVTISIADGTYPEAVSLSQITGGGTVLIQGNTTTPANVIVQGGSSFAFMATAFAPFTLSGMEIRSTSSSGINAQGGSVLIGSAVRFGACSIHHVVSQFGGIVTFTANYSIVGSTSTGSHIVALWGGTINLFFGATVTLTGTPSFGQAFAVAQTSASIFAWSQTYSGSGTGKRFQATGNGVIDTNGAATTYFPGGTAGTTATGGQYI